MDFAHKTGELDGVTHDAGVFFQGERGYYLGIFTWEGPSPDGDGTEALHRPPGPGHL